VLPEIAPAPALAAGLLLTFGGLAMLAQGIDRHHREVWDAPLPPGRAPFWRIGGAAVLGAAYGVVVMGFGLSIGLAVQLGLASLALPALAFGLAFAPRRSRPLLLAAPLVGVVIAAIAL
jgi:hypothetical protein